MRDLLRCDRCGLHYGVCIALGCPDRDTCDVPSDESPGVADVAQPEPPA